MDFMSSLMPASTEIFLLIMAAMFQSIFQLAQWPMDWIRDGVDATASAVARALPPGDFTDLLTRAGLTVTDRTAYATGAPKTFDSLADFAALQLARLDPAQATLTDAALVAGRVFVLHLPALHRRQAPDPAGRHQKIRGALSRRRDG